VSSIRTLKGPNQLGRWIPPVFGGVAQTSQAFVAGTVYLVQFTVPMPCTTDGLAYVVGATSNGNVIGGVVGPVSRTADIPSGAAVVAQSASTPMGSASAPQVLTWTGVQLLPGLYYAALECDSATGTYMRLPNQAQAPGIAATYARSGGYGALPDPGQSAASTGTAIPGMLIRVAA
jgi:hypothetical protein